ncbi:MAG TPA: NADP-dependent phosphogluconate dehydrogenase [Anaerolineaceae bacterium]|nr:NADP-dependent phosphogluconate dehydrogenase [Anaerolineaceae bacterium]
MGKAQIGLIGLAVMGQNLVLNMERNGYTVAVYNRTAQTMRDFVAAHPGKKLLGCENLMDFVAAIDRPRKMMLMVKAGLAVDAVIEQLLPLLDVGDLIIDGGNSFFEDTERRSKDLEARDLRFIGTGVSGGEEGALKGPSIMPGGQPEAYAMVKDIFTAISAKVDGEPCVTYIGPRGAGHYVKSVHNGIEYGDMQLIAEAYDILHRALQLSDQELADIFAEWNRGELQSYLIEITSHIFTQIDPETGQPLVDLILDEAQQKGTGKWTSQNALDLGVPIPTINAAVESRILSALLEERQAASQVLSGPGIEFRGERKVLIEKVRDALYMAKICSYAQGMALLRAASRDYDYNLHPGEIAAIWRGGCIIRAQFLNRIREAYGRQPDLPNLMLDEGFRQDVTRRQSALRYVVETAVNLGIPCAALASALSYFDAYRTRRLPANLTQAQRDYFGAHTFKRIDKPGVFHVEWPATE